MPVDTTDKKDLFRQATEATARALSGDPELSVTFGGSHPESGDHAIRLPNPSKAFEEDEQTLLRGYADEIALRMRHHDRQLHQRFQPNDVHARAAYEALEDARIEAVGGEHYAGAAANITAVLRHDAKRQKINAAKTTEDVAMSVALRHLARQALTGQPVPSEAKKAVTLWQDWINECLGTDGMDTLRAARYDQGSYARATQKILEKLQLTMAVSEPPPEEAGEDEKSEEAKDNQNRGQDEDTADAPSMTEPADVTAEMEGAETEGGEQETDFEQSEEDDDLVSEEAEDAPQDLRNDPNNARFGDYRVYTTAFDEVIDAKDLADADELDRLRKTLDKQLSQMQSVVSRLANRLQRQLMAQQTRSWHFDLEEGILDAARLSRIVTNPYHSVAYKQESETRFRDTVVTLLIDNSGSMRGRPIGIAAMSTDILARTLERCGVKTEILGFTTRAWKGGASREQWLAEGKPAHPGRLNDLRHIIYKSAESPWRHARNNLGLMLREGILKENIDGEALLWAHARLMARSEQRRIMMVISDGAPVDDSTLSANQGSYLEDHLRRAIRYIEDHSPVQLLAIGIGHDVTRYYQRAVTISDASELGHVMTDKLAELFDDTAPPARHRLRSRR